MSWDGGGDGVHWDVAANWAGDVLPVAGDDVVINVPGSAATVVRALTPTFASVTNHETITVRGNGVFGNVGLYAGSVSNFGTIELTSVDSSWSAELGVTGNVTNQAGGSIQSLAGFGGVRNVNAGGTLTNSGSISAPGAVTFNVANLLNTGDVSSTSRLTFFNTVATWSGNTTVTGNVYQSGGSINITSTTANFTIRAQSVTRFLGNQSPNATVWVQGNGLAGNAVLDVPAAGATNLGVIQLESADSSWDSVIVVADPGTLTNGTTGVIRSLTGTGGPRRVTGKVVSSGLFEAPGYGLDLFGTYTMNGGRATTGVQFRAVTLSTTASPTSSNTLVLSGSTALTGNVAAGYTLWVQGNGTWGNGLLNIGSNTVNNGTILLESIDSTWDSSITVAAGSVLTNSGLIDVNTGFGGPRVFTGRLTNGTIGQISVANGSGLYLNAFDNGLQTRGLVVLNGSLAVEPGGRFTIDQARVQYGNVSTGNLYVRNSTIDVLAGVGTSTLIAEGANTLVANASPNVTIWVQGNSLAGHGVLSMNPGGTTNNGTLRLESIDSSWDSAIDATNGLTNASTGVIRSGGGTGGARYLAGTHTNRGQIEAPSYFLNVSGTHIADGGRSTLDVIFRSVTLSTIGTYASPTTLKLSGATVLLTAVPANMELWLQGNNIDGHAQLVRAGTLTNNGTLRLESVDSSWTVTLLVEADLINNGTLVTNVGANGPRFIDIVGNLDGTGTTQLNQPSSSLIADRIRQASVSLSDASVATIRPNGTDTATSKAVFTLSPSSRFIVNDNAVIIDYAGASPLASIGGLMTSGYNFGFWNSGVGINSDVASFVTGKTIGYSEATDTSFANGTFAGLSVDSTAVLIRQTLVGDVNLDRVVNFDDLLRLAQNYGSSGARWSQGDLFYNGTVDFDDLLGLAQKYGTSYITTSTRTTKRDDASRLV